MKMPSQLLPFVLGRRSDWHLRMPSMPRLRFSRRLLGPLTIIGTLVGSWFAFAGAQGEGSVALGLWAGAVAILLMAWSFILAVRPKVLEPVFGGLDSMYRAHRWTGALSIAWMWLHTSIEPEVQGGIRGASRSVADSAEDLAGTGQTLLYLLVGLSVVRLIPYRWWRWSHKLLGVPFVFASWHFFTAEKTYANGSAWGYWFGAWMLFGIGAWLLRVVGIDMVRRGRHYRVVAADHQGTTTRLELAPVGRPLRQKLGQFAFVKLDVPGLSEPHPFTIASSPDDANLEFMIRHLGDWSQRLPDADLVGASVMIEGPYGEFQPLDHRADNPRADNDHADNHRADNRSGREADGPVWVAGGVGITPFLAAIGDLSRDASLGPKPTLLYAVRETDDNMMLDRVRQAADAGLVDLHLFTPATGRMSPADFDRVFPTGMAGRHVALCGPAGLVASMADAAGRRGARTIETEDFDIRQGFGPERSVEIARFVESTVGRLRLGQA